MLLFFKIYFNYFFFYSFKGFNIFKLFTIDFSKFRLFFFKRIKMFQFFLIKSIMRPHRRIRRFRFINYRKKKFLTIFGYQRPRRFVRWVRLKFLSLFFIKGKYKFFSNFVKNSKSSTGWNLYWFFSNSIGFLTHVYFNRWDYMINRYKHRVIWKNNKPIYALWDQLNPGDIIQLSLTDQSLISFIRKSRRLNYLTNRFFFNNFFKYFIFKHRSRKLNWFTLLKQVKFLYLTNLPVMYVDFRTKTGVYIGPNYLNSKDYLNFFTFSIYNWKISI